MRLGGGKAYYMQVVCAQDVGKDSCSVGMQLPNGKMSRPIKGEYLSRKPLGRSLFTCCGLVLTCQLDSFIQGRIENPVKDL